MIRQHIIAATVVDGAGTHVSPGAVLLEGDRVIAAGGVAEVGLAGDAQRVELPGSCVIPAFVNAHAHLDLTRIGPVAYEGKFSQWLDGIVKQRMAMQHENAVPASVLQGAELSKKGGTAIVGDIAGGLSIEAVQALRRSGLRGVSYLEVIGIGQGQEDAIERLDAALAGVAREESCVRLGVSPHAPFTCGLEVYRAAADLGLPMATHLAESLEELQFFDKGDGPFAELLQRAGRWDQSIRGNGCHPVDLIGGILADVPCVAAHLNYVGDEQIERIASSGMSVGYCPRASAYFGHPHEGHPPHRYRDMLGAGINVALGTDSMVCLDTADRISVLDEMRLLYRRDSADPGVLLEMATVNGAKALGFDVDLVTLKPGPVAGVLALHGATLEEALRNDDPPQWVTEMPTAQS